MLTPSTRMSSAVALAKASGESRSTKAYDSGVVF